MGFFECAIKVKGEGDKTWWFLSPKGANRLRVHASLFSRENALKALEDLRKNNPELRFKLVSASTWKDDKETDR